MTQVVSVKPDFRTDDVDIVESMTASAPPSIALESMQHHVQASNGRIALIIPAQRNEDAPDSLDICSFPMTIQAHHNRAVTARFDFEVDWHPDNAKYPNIHGRMTVGGLGVKTELAFKGWYELARESAEATVTGDCARAIVRGVLSQFKAVLEDTARQAA